MNHYKPPYTITEEMLNLVSDITEKLGRMSILDDLSKYPRLRRANMIRSIHSSLAIENNSLSLEQVSDILNGKRVLGPIDEIQEVKNAIKAYKDIASYRYDSLYDLKKAHSVMMEGIADDAGKFRSGEEGVFAGQVCVHTAPPARMVDGLMKDLFSYVSESKVNPLIKSSVFHYEFEFIHPFSDGNGRTGRFWQTVILSAWKPIFNWIPVENVIIGKQAEYYAAIGQSNRDASGDAFIMFMLNAISEAVDSMAVESAKYAYHIDGRVAKLMSVMPDYPVSATEIMDLLGLKSRDTFRNNYLKPALEADIIGMTDPGKPTSKNQRYYKK